MKRMFLKSLLLSLMFFCTPYLQTGEPGTFGHISEPELPSTGLITNHTHLPEEHLSEETLRLEHIQEEELKLRTPHHAQLPLHDQDPLKRPVLTQPSDITIENTLDATLTDEELTAVIETEHLTVSKTHPTDPTHLTNHHAQLNFIRKKIIQHLTNELIKVKEKLTPEQIKNREMVIKFFDKAGELPEENVVKFRTIYKKLAEWDGKSELTLTINEQKEMKLFLQSIVTTYCTKRQSEA